MLETERLVLCPPEMDDVEGNTAVFGDPEVVAFLGIAPQTRTENLAGIRKMSGELDGDTEIGWTLGSDLLGPRLCDGGRHRLPRLGTR